GTPAEHAEPRARCVDERPVEPALAELAHVGIHDPDVRRPEPTGIRRQLAGSPGVQLDGGDLAAQHRRLPARRRARVEDALAGTGADDEPRELRAATLGPDPALRERGRIDA